MNEKASKFLYNFSTLLGPTQNIRTLDIEKDVFFLKLLRTWTQHWLKCLMELFCNMYFHELKVKENKEACAMCFEVRIPKKKEYKDFFWIDGKLC